MDRTEILKKAKLVVLKTRQLLNNLVVGDFKTRQKGSGFEFDQLTDYQFGADTRFIDWKSSARMQKLLIKEFRQERSRFLHVMCDMSASQLYGSDAESKFHMSTTIAGIVSMAGIYAQDFVSCMGYSDSVSFYVPPGKGFSHGFKILETMLSKSAIKAKSTRIIEPIEQYIKRNIRAF